MLMCNINVKVVEVCLIHEVTDVVLKLNKQIRFPWAWFSLAQSCMYALYVTYTYCNGNAFITMEVGSFNITVTFAVTSQELASFMSGVIIRQIMYMLILFSFAMCCSGFLKLHYRDVSTFILLLINPLCSHWCVWHRELG